MLDEMARRFPETYIYWSFVATLIAATLETLLIVYLVRDVWRHREDRHLGLRIGVSILLSGTWVWRIYATSALWHYHWDNVPRVRLAADSWLIASVIIFAALWGRDVRRRDEETAE